MMKSRVSSPNGNTMVGAAFVSLALLTGHATAQTATSQAALAPSELGNPAATPDAAPVPTQQATPAATAPAAVTPSAEAAPTAPASSPASSPPPAVVPPPYPSPTTSPAQSHAVEPAKPLQGRRTLGIGIQAAPFPLFGPSVIYSPVAAVGLELLGEAFVDVDWVGARALLRPFPRPGHRFYFSGLVGYFVDSDVSTSVFAPRQTATALGYGAGIGFAFFFKRQSPWEMNLELDYIHIAWEPKWWKYDFGATNIIMAGLGLHYYVL